MIMVLLKSFIVVASVFICFFTENISGYGLPAVDLGFTNILDGGPVRPYPGIYWQQYLQYYTTKRFRDNKGGPLVDLDGSHFRQLETITQFVYQFDKELPLKGMPGVTLVLPLVIYSKIAHNKLGIQSSGSGFGNLGCGVYTQWSAIELHGRPFFIHRLEFDFSIPMGKNKLPQKQINPSNSFFYCGPEWSATLYLSYLWSLSWRLDYVWSAKNEKIDFQAGDVILCNYSLAYEAYPNLFIAAVGYALQQLHNNRALGVTVPDSKERVFGIGPGLAYFFSQDLVFFSYLYLEEGVRNRPQGTSFIARVVMHF